MKNLSRAEMKSISGGLVDGGGLVGDGAACPKDDCSVHTDCDSKSYCANTTCSVGKDLWSSYNSCQWTKK